MPYIPVPRPLSLPHRVTATVERLERQYLREVHVMLRLPIPNYRLSSDCVFSCAQTLLSIIGGASTLLYAHRDSSPGKDFKALLLDFYPWDEEPNLSVTASEAARIIYEVFRNPLAHNLGAHVRPRLPTPLVKLKRARRRDRSGGLSERSIESLERPTRPLNMLPAITVRPGDATVLFIEPLYWGIRAMLTKLLRDNGRMAQAETFLAKVR